MPRVIRLRSRSDRTTPLSRNNPQRRRQVRAQIKKTNSRRRALFRQTENGEFVSDSSD